MAFNPWSLFAWVGIVTLTIVVGFGGGVFLTAAFVRGIERDPAESEQSISDKVKPITAAVAAAAEAEVKPAGVPAIPAVQSLPVPHPFPHQPIVQDSYAKANETEVQLEARRQEHVRRAEQRKGAELKRRKVQERRVIAGRKRQEEQSRQAQAFERERVAQSPRLDFESSP